MASQLKCKAAFSGVRTAPVQTRVVRVSAQKQESLAVAAVTFAATALLTGAADAKVVLEQPQLKKVFQADGSAPAAPSSSSVPSIAKGLVKPAAKAAPKPKAESSESSEGIDPKIIALPTALVGIAGGYLALSKLDDGFNDFLGRTAVRDSNDYAGFEVAIKEGRLPGTKKSGTSFKLPSFGKGK